MGKVIGPGSLIADLTGFAPHFPALGETVMGSTLRIGPGGKGSNQMTAAHRAGADVCLIGRRGEDFLGRVLEAHYAAEGMREDRIVIDPKGETGSAFIEVQETDGQNRIIVIFASNTQVSREDVLRAKSDFSDADAVLCQFETGLTSIEAALELARKYRIPSILNPAPFMDFPKSVFRGVDYVTPNETEAEQYTGVRVETLEDCRKAAERFFEMGVRNVIITLGVRGAYYTNGKDELTVPGIRVKAVETTGAGDAFNGGLACAISEGLDIGTALKFANCTAAISVTRPGSSPSMPQRSEILELMKSEYGIEL